jgi:D-isomer specific 2-hydroxyacid dehydrogenase, NAD binding domain
VIQVPLTKETHHLFGETELRRMKPTAFLIMTAASGQPGSGNSSSYHLRGDKSGKPDSKVVTIDKKMC